MAGQVGKTDTFKWALERPAIAFAWLILSSTAVCSKRLI